MTIKYFKVNRGKFHVSLQNYSKAGMRKVNKTEEIREREKK